jgi:hypothetical protein
VLAVGGFGLCGIPGTDRSGARRGAEPHRHLQQCRRRGFGLGVLLQTRQIRR